VAGSCSRSEFLQRIFTQLWRADILSLAEADDTEDSRSESLPSHVVQNVVLFIDDGGYLAPVAKAPYDGGQRNQAMSVVSLDQQHAGFQYLIPVLFCQ
jgi:hypothetical protein